MRSLIVIPARYKSTRYPGKPLAPLKGATGEAKTLIERTWRAAQRSTLADEVIVATDDERIAEVISDLGGQVVMTSESCRNGTERCAEVAAGRPEYDLYVNFQGDAPLTPPWFIDDMIRAMADRPEADVATPVLNCSGAMRDDLLADRRAGRVGGTTAVIGAAGKALYFSKEVIPFSAAQYAADERTPVYHHVGAYAYRAGALQAYLSLPEGPAERNEGLEQLRFLENGIAVLCVECDARGRAFWELNNPEDTPKIEAMLMQMGEI